MKVSLAGPTVFATILYAAMTMSAHADAGRNDAPERQVPPASPDSTQQKNCSPASLAARTKLLLADELGVLRKDVVPAMRVSEHVLDPFDEIALVTALEDEFNISFTEEEVDRIIGGTVQTAIDAVRAKHRRLPANACHSDVDDFSF